MKSLREILDACQYEFNDEEITDVNQHSLSGDTPLHVSCLRGDIDSVKTLIAAGADIHAVGDLDRTPLFVAIMVGNVELARYLIEQGSSLDHKDDGGKTPLEYARSLQRGNALNSPEMIPLLEAGSDKGSQ